MSIMKLFHSLGRKLTAKTLRDYPYRLKHKGIAQIPDVGEAESTGAQMYQTLVDAGLKPEDMHKFIKSEKDIIKYLNIIKSTRKQALEQATKKSKDILKVTKKKERPFTGWTPKVVERSMSADDYAALKEEWFSRIMTNTDEALNTFLKRGINASDERFVTLSKDQRKDFLDMVQYRLKHGNEKFMNDFTDDKGVFNKFPEEKEDGGIAGMLGERTGFDIGGGIFSSTPDTAVKFNLDGETIFLNPDFFEVFMGPYMDDPEKFKRRTDDLKQEIRRNQSTVALAGGGLAPLLGEPTYADGGRIGFKNGTKFDPKRRSFMKIAAGLAALPVVGKFFKWAKPLAKTAKVADLTSVPIKNAAGMPVWFKPLVNKVIKEGTEVPSGAERVITHKTKLPNSKTDVYVNQDLNNGNVWVDIGAEKHGFPDGKFGQPVRLEYKAAEEIEPILPQHMDPKDPKGFWKPHKDQKTKPEFTVEEAEFTGGHPENIKFEESTISKFGKHESNFDEVEMFAKGKTKKTRDISSLQKQNEDLADHFSNYPEPDDFASGGRVPLAEGKAPFSWNTHHAGVLDPEWDEVIDPDEWLHILKLLKAGEFGAAEGGRVPLGGGGILKLLKLFKKKPETLKEFIERRNFLKGMIGNTDNMKNKRILQEILEETENVKGFEFPESGVGSDIHKEIEMILNKDVTKHATGGRVPLAGGKKVLEGLAWLANKIAPKSTKIGKTSRPMSPKTELKQAIAGFQEREAAAKLKEMIRKKYQGRIDDDLLNKILVDDNPQRIAEVLATIDEALLMQGKGMGPDQVIQTIKESWKRKPQASGGVAGMLGK